MILRLLFFLTFLFVQKTDKPPKGAIIFIDNFKNTSLDLKHWNYDLGDGCPELCGWGNKEYQNYTKENVFLRNEKLVIKATIENNRYFSGRITTKDKIEFQYGTVEVKAKLPRGKGVWPAIWMLGHDIDENYWPDVERSILWSMSVEHRVKFITPFIQKTAMEFQKTLK